MGVENVYSVSLLESSRTRQHTQDSDINGQRLAGNPQPYRPLLFPGHGWTLPGPPSSVDTHNLHHR